MPCARGGIERKFSFECRADAERRNPARVCAALDGSGAVDEAVWRFGLRNARRARDGGAGGRDDPKGLDGLRSRPGLEWARAGATGEAAGDSYGAAAGAWREVG